MFPHFLCIGAQKAGTSWLHYNLKQHPQVWLPPIKELHYFDYPDSMPYIFKVTASTGHGRRARKTIRKFIGSATTLDSQLWFCRYLLYPRHSNWYSSLFLPKEGQICGEMTPKYGVLSEDKVARIYALMPNLKVIYLLRNPIDREWSGAAMHFDKKGYETLDDVSESELMHYFGKQKYSYYLSTLHTWKKYYGNDQIFVGFYDQLKQDPKSLLQEIYRFLSVDDSEYHIPDSADQKVNSRPYPQMPVEIKHFLIETYSQTIEQLHQMFDNEYTEQWLQSTQDP